MYQRTTTFASSLHSNDLGIHCGQRKSYHLELKIPDSVLTPIRKASTNFWLEYYYELTMFASSLLSNDLGILLKHSILWNVRNFSEISPDRKKERLSVSVFSTCDAHIPRVPKSTKPSFHR